MQILGIDDWLIFARTDDDRLVYTQVETHGDWFDTPGRGLAEYGTTAWRVDWSHMFLRVTRQPDRYYWQQSEYPLDISDEQFMAQSRHTHLID